MRAVMLKRISWCALLLVFLAAEAEAQRRGGTTRRRTSTTTTTTEEEVVNPATGNAVTPPPAPAEGNAAATPLRPDDISMPVVDTPRKSLRVDGVTSKNSVRDRVPIAYDNI